MLPYKSPPIWYGMFLSLNLKTVRPKLRKMDLKMFLKDLEIKNFVSSLFSSLEKRLFLKIRKF